MAKKGGGSQGGMAGAFASYVGRGATNVKFSYIGKDNAGRPIYKFTYQSPSRLPNSAGRLMTHTSNVAVEFGGSGQYSFGRPGTAANTRINQPGDAGTGGTAARNDLLGRAVEKVGDLINRGLITTEQGKTLTSNFGSWSDTALRMWISRAGTGNRVTPRVYETGVEGEAPIDDLFGAIGDFGGGGGGFGGGGGGGGAAEPGVIYKAPDKRVVTDYVKGVLTTKLGFVPEHLLGPGVEQYMVDHRAAFDRELAAEVAAMAGTSSDIEEIDPQMSVIEYVRNTQEYQTIHKLRPDGEDEDEWVAKRRALGERGGLETDLDQFAVNQATIAGSAEDVERAGAMQQFQKSGQMPTIIDNQFRTIAQAMAMKVAR